MAKVHAVLWSRGVIVLIETDTARSVPKKFRRSGLAGCLRFCKRYGYTLENPEAFKGRP